jgi:RecA-family ATPase
VSREIIPKPLAGVRTRRTEWVYTDRIPLRTGTMLAGQGGIAKSTILANWIAKATRGELPGSFFGQPIAVGLVSPEDDIESILVPRLLAAGADLDLVFDLSTVVVTDSAKTWKTLPNIADDLPALADTIRANSIRLLIVDPLVSIMSGNSISQSDVRRNFDPLCSMAAELDLALLAVAHFGKSGERAGDRLSGSHAFRDITRSLILAAVDDETDLRILTVDKSNYSKIKPSDAYRVDSADVLLDDGYSQSVGKAVMVGESTMTVQDLMDRDRDNSSLSEHAQKIIAFVNEHPDGVKTGDVIAGMSNVPEATVRKALTRAVDRGDIQRHERGMYGPLSQVPSVPSVPSVGHERHKRPYSSLGRCPKCGNESDPVNAAFEYTHPGCDAA